MHSRNRAAYWNGYSDGKGALPFSPNIALQSDERQSYLDGFDQARLEKGIPAGRELPSKGDFL